MRRFGALGLSVVVGVLGGVVVLPSVASADGVREGQWYLDGFDIDAVHDLSQGAGVRIGLIDSGVDATHPDLEGNVEPGLDLVKSGDKGLVDKLGHGTSVASILVGHGHGTDNGDGVLGIAPEATVIPVRVADNDDDIDTDDIVTAIDWLVEQDVDIISISLGAGSSPDGFNVVDKAVDAGIAVIAAAGNIHTGTGGHTETHTQWPASAPGVTPVAGTTQDGTFWEDGSDLSLAAPQPRLGLSAPATSMPTAQPGNAYDVSDGTSLATPIVAGTYALVMAAYPDLDFFVQEDRILDTVDDKGDKGFDDHYGWGIVNPLGSLTEETSYDGPDGTVVSSPDDILPLDQQGKSDSGSSPGNGPVDPAASDDAGALTPVVTDTIPVWMSVVAAVIFLAVAVLVVVALIRRRRTKSLVPPIVPRPTQPGAPY